MTQPAITTEFPEFDNRAEFDAMAILLGDAFKDRSWHNESCPSLGADIGDSSEFCVSVFVDYANPAMREAVVDDGEFATRFYVVVMWQGECAEQYCREFSDMVQAALWAKLCLAAEKAATFGDLLNAVRQIQDAAMQKDGGVASIYFSQFDNEFAAWREMSKTERRFTAFQYAASEFSFSPITQ